MLQISTLHHSFYRAHESGTKPYISHYRLPLDLKLFYTVFLLWCRFITESLILTRVNITIQVLYDARAVDLQGGR